MAGARRMLHACLQAALGGPQHEDPMCGQQGGVGELETGTERLCAVLCVLPALVPACRGLPLYVG